MGTKYSFARELRTELIDVDKVFKQNLLPWWDDIYSYIKLLDDDLTWNQLPPLVYIVYQYLGLDRSISISMTNIFKTLYLANSIHGRVTDDEEGQKYDRELQFSILIGDYMFGRMLKLLVEAGADKLVGHFAGMMAEINEGRVMEWKLQADHKDVLLKTRGSLYATAFETAAQLSGMSGMLLQNCRQLGLNLGMSIELMSCDIAREEVLVYIHEAERNFKIINQQHQRRANSSMESAINEIHLLLCNIDNVAVV
ncbi:MAG: polyprenyl synthetase family protein [Syntrophomonas sp.]|uniref:polyprenyl synthetase family protein n=1 Tax=Syntrophomonas sp. TaxID=2053627 RepID=UPI0026221469|nr:polyprenyl synthetase family protein [Syntrophomonas sp.]MDD2510432.1 polyprenyl synthetase family protein [Syntrophomonas sp.]MDD3878457.1 polyprenyl synthetase family protein [Syntrophomonas sp.]MDD4625893.1 polyprenyl synthetase family protein [Syntrophomonas sp.]